jgi:flagellar secretion chaperone FliS
VNPIARYEEQAITTQSPGRLIVLLYEGAIRFLRQAAIAADAGDPTTRNRYLARSQDILMELNTSLNLDAGGAIARNLRAIYLFLWKHLNLTGSRNNTQGIRQVIAILEELLGGWKAIVTA